MRKKRLRRIFFLRPAITVARDLLGMYLVRSFRGGIRAGKIVETEAYLGAIDKASHSYGGKVTPRNISEYLCGGHVYIYLCYGMYWQLNVTVMKEGCPECVLIRALEPIISKAAPAPSNICALRTLTSGPGRLCRWLQLKGSFDREDLVTSRRLWIEDRGVKVPRSQIVAAPRIGIEYAGKWARVPLRFFIAGNRFVSHPAR